MATMYQKTQLDLVERLEQKAVQIATLQHEIENLQKEMAYYDDLHQKVREERDQVREERDCLVRDLRVRQMEAKQSRVWLPHFEQQCLAARAILVKAANYTDAVIVFELADLSRDFFAHYPELYPVEKACEPEPAAKAG